MCPCGSGFMGQFVQCASGVCYVWQCACVAGCRCVCTFADVTGVRKCVVMAVVYSVRGESVLLHVCVLCGSRSVVTRCRGRPSPPLPLETLVGGACTGRANGELLILMVGRGRKTGQHSHKVHPGK